MIATGQRDKRVRIETPGSMIPDGEGGFIEDWETVAEVFVQIKPATQTDLERAAAGTVLSTATHVISLLYHSGVTIESRLRLSAANKPDRLFQVTAVRNPEEADRELVLVAEEQL